MSEKEGITVRQTAAYTIHLWPHGLGTLWFTPFEGEGTLIRSVPMPNSRKDDTGPYDKTTTWLLK